MQQKENIEQGMLNAEANPLGDPGLAGVAASV
jgi:hypothetical protein